ncbi:MAG: hypothetical protein QOD75_1693 [Blastocatellia bacterium]|jgi:uncharacterized lipoprotein YddW (UPF0748 family)|nr:hypothetical protein [Blastocatellia bacterium]
MLGENLPLTAVSAVLALIYLLQPSPAASQTVAPPPNEVRALWVVRTTLTSPERIRTMVNAAADNGFNTIIVQVRGRGDAYYRSHREPRANELKDQPADFDPLAVTLTEAKRRGLKVHAWVNTSLLANLDALPTNPEHIYNKHPEWLAVPHPIAAELYNISPKDPRYRARIVEWSKANTAELEGVYTGPANAKVREHIYQIWMDILKNYDVDGIHFDYIRLASPDFDYSRTSLDNFRKWLDQRGAGAVSRSSRSTVPGESRGTRQPSLFALSSLPGAAGLPPSLFALSPMPGQPFALRPLPEGSALALAEAYPERFADFQREQITTLVQRIYREVKRRKPNVTVSAAVFANDENAYTRRFQNWRRWLQMGILDVVCPMAYTTDTEIFKTQIKTATQLAHANNKQIWSGMGAYRLPIESTVEKINAARSLKSDGIILFSYDFTIRPSALNPNADYLERVRHNAFERPGPE